jgi:hypothetical protein
LANVSQIPINHGTKEDKTMISKEQKIDRIVERIMDHFHGLGDGPHGLMTFSEVVQGCGMLALDEKGQVERGLLEAAYARAGERAKEQSEMWRLEREEYRAAEAARSQNDEHEN